MTAESAITNVLLGGGDDLRQEPDRGFAMLKFMKITG